MFLEVWSGMKQSFTSSLAQHSPLLWLNKAIFLCLSDYTSKLNKPEHWSNPIKKSGLNLKSVSLFASFEQEHSCELTFWWSLSKCPENMSCTVCRQSCLHSPVAQDGATSAAPVQLGILETGQKLQGKEQWSHTGQKTPMR